MAGYPVKPAAHAYISDSGINTLPSLFIPLGSLQEMCAMSAYLLSSTRREVVTYLEDAISVYNITCK